MSQLQRCPNGHEWEVTAAVCTDARVPCPVCGTPAQAVDLPATQSLPPPVPLPSADAAEPFPAVPGYEILGELGRGGMGIVYQARQTARDRVVALKVIRKERLAHPEVVRRFRREAQAAARLSHPNIVAVYEADQEGDTHFLAMEYVPGVTLQRLVEEGGPLPVDLACDVVRQTALALQHAAEQALVHRDVKPSNLMLVGHPAAGRPSRPLVKILDMGVARLYQLRDLAEDSLTTLTRDGSVIGTPDYVAPEQLEDPHAADIRADLYSLGCTFYFLLAGRVPFPGGTLVQKLDRQRWETPPSVDQLRREVPAAVAAVVRRLMAKHPDDRYRTPGELAAALEQLARTGVLPAGYQPIPLSEIRCLRGHAGPVAAVAFLSDGRSLVSAGADRTLRLWDAAGGTERACFGQAPQAAACLAVVPPAGLVLAGQGVGLRLWDPATGKEVLRLAGHTDAVRGLSVTSDGRRVLSGGDDRTLRLWDLAGGREMQRLAGHKAGVTGVALSPDGRLALSGGKDQTLRLWDLARGREMRSFPVPRGQVLAVAFTPDGKAALSAHFDTTLRLWDLDSGRELRRFAGHRQMVAGVVLTPAGLVISGSHDQTVRVWDPDSGAELWCGRGHAGPVTAVASAPDGRTLASAGLDETVRLWQVPG
jgi:WD40 repeat protein/tRNA A-37 threonylcarbamoyl transferase component Bud32